MRLSKRFGAITATLALASGGALALASTGGAAAPPPIDVSSDHVTCATMYGSFKFTPGIGVLPAAPTTSTVKLTLDGCTDLDNANVKLAPSKAVGTVSYATNDGTALLGKSNVTGSLTITWKTAPGAAKLTSPTTTLSFSQINTLVTSVSTSAGALGSGSYGMFSTGTAAAHGSTNAPSVSGNFKGSDNGISSYFDGISSQDVIALSGPVLSGKGLKIVPVGIGQIHLG